MAGSPGYIHYTATAVAIASSIPRLRDLNNHYDVARWASYIHESLRLLGLEHFIEKDQPRPHGQVEQQSWELKRGQAVWILKASLADIWTTLMNLQSYGNDKHWVDIEENPRRIFLMATKNYDLDFKRTWTAAPSKA